jgi:DNA-binding NarL/FixJ family response regulator
VEERLDERRLADVRAFLSDRDRPITGIALERLTSIQKATAGDMDGALGHATAAVDAAAAQQRPTDESLALLQRARVLHRKRQVTLARADLEAARDRARDSGIGAIGVVAERALAGTRQKRSPTELTASEEAVIALVREGGTNREIAAQLFVSVRTVESHVAAILRKSGASSRSRLISRGGAPRPPS